MIKLLSKLSGITYMAKVLPVSNKIEISIHGQVWLYINRTLENYENLEEVVQSLINNQSFINEIKNIEL